MDQILSHWNIPTHLLPLFCDACDGVAVLALLANAGAKDWPDRPGNPALYALKAATVQRACGAARAGCSWQDTHDGMPISFIQTRLIFDGAPLQLAFHFRAGDTLPDLPDWPTADGWRWSRQQAPPYAREIARQYLAARGVVLS